MAFVGANCVRPGWVSNAAHKMTQAALATAARVSLRSIQLYEQRKNDIRKAQYNHLKDIADVLHCGIEDILG